MRIQVLRFSVPHRPQHPSPATPCLPALGGAQRLDGLDLNKLRADPPGNGDLRQVHRAWGLTFPKARSTESKYRSIPKRIKKMPKPVVPTPISAMGKEVVVGWALGSSLGCWNFPPLPLDRCPLGGRGWRGSIAIQESWPLCSQGMTGGEGKGGHESMFITWKLLVSSIYSGVLSSQHLYEVARDTLTTFYFQFPLVFKCRVT